MVVGGQGQESQGEGEGYSTRYITVAFLVALTGHRMGLRLRSKKKGSKGPKRGWLSKKVKLGPLGSGNWDY